MKALIIAGRHQQDHEFIYPYYRLQEAGYEVDVAVKDKEPVVGYFGTKITPTLAINEVRSEQYRLLIIPGGVKAMEHMRLDPRIISIIQNFHLAKKTIGCICSGAQLLISAKIVKGKKISAYYAMKDDVENAGATFVDAPAVNCDRIVTSPHYKYLGDWMKEVLKEAERDGSYRTGWWTGEKTRKTDGKCS